jgi:hypothetical protein
MNFCKDCKHYEFANYGPHYQEHICRRTGGKTISLVTGEPLSDLIFCGAERTDDSYIDKREQCGSSGIYWEPK